MVIFPFYLSINFLDPSDGKIISDESKTFFLELTLFKKYFNFFLQKCKKVLTNIFV